VDKFRFYKYAKLYDSRPNKALADDHYTEPTRIEVSDHNPENNRNTIRNRYNFNLQSVKYLLLALNMFGAPLSANEVGRKSATANPIAN
jgi:hypothetical protein